MTLTGVIMGLLAPAERAALSARSIPNTVSTGALVWLRIPSIPVTIASAVMAANFGPGSFARNGAETSRAWRSGGPRALLPLGSEPAWSSNSPRRTA
jgi:hypothetical protein